MDYEQKRRLILAGFIGLVILIIGLLILGLRGGGDVATVNTSALPENQNAISETAKIEEKVYNEVFVLPAPFSEARKTAKIFVERYGSYSSQSNFQNIEDAIYLASSKLAVSLQQTLDEKRKIVTGGEVYNGVATKVLADEVISGKFGEEKTVLLLKTQRITSTGSDNSGTKYQDAEVTVIKENGMWKVDEMRWK